MTAFSQALWARVRTHRYGLTLVAFLLAAVLTGLSCVALARAFDRVVEWRLQETPWRSWAWIIAPIAFLIAVESIRRFAPYAAGTGIPQAVYTSEHLNTENEKRLLPLISMKTMAVKVLTLLLGVWVGASTGREGPTVHVAVCVFVGILLLIRRWTGLAIDLRSAAIAGGAAGLAAAFNTPLAGVTFAIEELSENYFGAVKDIVLMAIIVAATVARALTGEYSYFGKLTEPTSFLSTGTIVLIGILCGGGGALFSELLLRGASYIRQLPQQMKRWGVPVLMALALLLVSAWAGDRVLGPGNRVAQQLLHGEYSDWAMTFPIAKMASTLFTYWSGIAGGIFAPCLSIGAAMGADIAMWTRGPAGSAALLGMAAFLAGTIQAPMTSFVIIFEMTGHHRMLLPIMLVSLIAFMTARVLGARHFYQSLASAYGHGE
jgi:H+/Cl- antiporter ClcA